MEIARQFGTAWTTATFWTLPRKLEPDQPADSLLGQAVPQMLQMPLAIELASLALGCQMPKWRWYAYLLPIGLAKATQTFHCVERAEPRATAQLAVWAQRHFGDLCQDVCFVSSLALLRNGNAIRGSATLSLMTAGFLIDRQILPASSKKILLATVLGLKMWTGSWSERIGISAVGGIVLARNLFNQFLVGHDEDFELKPAKPETFLPNVAGDADVNALQRAFNKLENLPEALATGLTERRMWNQFYASELTAKDFCQEGLTNVLAADNLHKWLQLLPTKLEDEDWVALCLAGRDPKTGGRRVYELFRKLCPDEELGEGWERSQRLEEFMTSLGQVAFVFEKYWLGCAPSPRLDGEPPPRPMEQLLVVYEAILRDFDEDLASDGE